MKKYWNSTKKYFLYTLWLVAVAVSILDIAGSSIELFTLGNITYIDFTGWKLFNSGYIFLLCIMAINLVSAVCIFFSYKNIKHDSLKAVLIMTVPLLIYNVFTYLNLM